MKRVAVVGAAGYAGIEMVRLVLGHPRMELVAATSSADAGTPLSSLYPHLLGVCDLTLVPHDDPSVADVDVAVLAVPHTAAIAMAPTLLARGVTVVDLSADFRLKDAGVYEEWYEVEHTAPELLAQAVYGLVEMNRLELPGAKLIASPGCYPTASVLAALPALEAGLIAAGTIHIDAKSGVSGAGRGANAVTHFCSAAEAVTPYKVAAHRHTPEIEQSYSQLAGEERLVTFAPHLVPAIRGLLSTVYLPLKEGVTPEAVEELYRARYEGECFVEFIETPAGSVSTRSVRGTNKAHVGIAVDTRTNTLVATCAIDNLVKGAAGQALQAANVALGFDEGAGLMTLAPLV